MKAGMGAEDHKLEQLQQQHSFCFQHHHHHHHHQLHVLGVKETSYETHAENLKSHKT
jgi:hypothetical protein